MEDEMDDIHSYVDRLVDDVEEYMEDEDISSSESQELLDAAKEFNSFTSNSQTCDCIYYFNRIISDLGGSSVLHEEKDGVMICSAKIGNFRFFYAYAKNNWLHKVSVSTSRMVESGFSSSGSASFGLYNEIEVFSVVKSKESWKISSVDVTVSSKNVGYSSIKCVGQFPRQQLIFSLLNW